VQSIFTRIIYRYELQSRGCTVQAEAPAPTRYTSSDGRVHVLTNDRIDHIVILDKEFALIEVKKSQPSETAKYDATQQIIRYCRNYKPAKKTELYCVFFPRYPQKYPFIMPVKYLPPNQISRSANSRKEAIEKLKSRTATESDKLKSGGEMCTPETPALLPSLQKNL